MARKVREKCERKIYHIIMRGIDRQTIFKDKEQCAQLFKHSRGIKRKANIKSMLIV
jgi:hypothetical protein